MRKKESKRRLFFVFGLLLTVSGSLIMMHASVSDLVSEDWERGAILTDSPQLFKLFAEGEPISKESVLSVPITEQELEAFYQHQYGFNFQKPKQRINTSRSHIVKTMGVAVEIGEVNADFGKVKAKSGGGLIWSAGIKSNRATGIRIHFSEVDVPANVELYIYSGTGEVAGPYMTKASIDDFWTDMVFGDTVYLHLRPKMGIKTVDLHSVRFVISEVAHMGSLIAKIIRPDCTVVEFLEAQPGSVLFTLSGQWQNPESILDEIFNSDQIQTSGLIIGIYEILTNGGMAPNELILAAERHRSRSWKKNLLAQKRGVISPQGMMAGVRPTCSHCDNGYVYIDGSIHPDPIIVYDRLKMSHTGNPYPPKGEDCTYGRIWHEAGCTIWWDQTNTYTLSNVPGSIKWDDVRYNKTGTEGPQGYYEIHNGTDLGCHEIMTVRYFRIPNNRTTDPNNKWAIFPFDFWEGYGNGQYPSEAAVTQDLSYPNKY